MATPKYEEKDVANVFKSKPSVFKIPSTKEPKIPSTRETGTEDKMKDLIKPLDDKKKK